MKFSTLEQKIWSSKHHSLSNSLVEEQVGKPKQMLYQSLKPKRGNDQENYNQQFNNSVFERKNGLIVGEISKTLFDHPAYLTSPS